MKLKLKPPGTKRLKLKYDEPLSNVAVKYNLHRYTLGTAMLLYFALTTAVYRGWGRST
jgi:hypothetical protein